MGGRRSLYGVLVGKPEGNQLEDPGLDGRIILRWIFRKWDMEWIELAQDKDKWRALVDAVMNLRVL